MTTLLKNILMVNCYLLTQTVLLMKYNQKIFMKLFLSTSICLISVTIQKIQRFFIRLIGKMIDVSEGKTTDEFVGVKSKMYSIKILMVKNLIQQKE